MYRFGKVNIIALFTFLLLPSIILVSCDAERVYEKNIDLENRQWLADSIADFDFHIAQAEDSYDIYFNFRNTISYPYHNLYVNYQVENSKGEVLLEDLYNMDLFDPKTGKPFGKGLGDIFSHEFKAIPNYQFPDTGTYTLKLQQYMRQDALPEILSVGISVKAAEPASE